MRIGKVEILAGMGIASTILLAFPPEELKKPAFAVSVMVVFVGLLALSVLYFPALGRIHQSKRGRSFMTLSIVFVLGGLICVGIWKSLDPMAVVVIQRESLYDRTSLLSTEILAFISERNAEEPELRTDQQNLQAYLAYWRRTNDLYAERFGARAVAIAAELESKGIPVDQRFHSLVAHPTNPLGIKEVGVTLGALAERHKSLIVQ